jgi:hypothetical protein
MAAKLDTTKQGAARNAILAAQPYVSIKDLARQWAPELDIEYSSLVAALLNYVLSTDEDELKIQIWDPSDSMISEIKRADFNSNLRRIADSADLTLSQTISRVILPMVKDRQLGVPRETVWKFCRFSNLTPPSFWPFPKTKISMARPVNMDERLSSFHNGRQKETESAARKAASEDEAIGKFTDAQWRKAWAERDPQTKYRRGERSP